tara:strand:- start:97 stop:501 length:405 start_codon:yes stop_codon:yes gene_type:complete
MSKYEDLRDILILMQYSDLHKTYNLEQICRCIVVPVMLNQYQVIRLEHELVMFGTWGFPNKKQLDEYLETGEFPHGGYQGGGKDVWMIDFISKKDYTLKGVKHFRYFFKKKGYQVAFWLRQRNKKLGFVKSARR